MSGKEKDELLNDHNHDGIDRRGFLRCMAWAGTGVLWVMQGGVLRSQTLSRMSELTSTAAGELSFVQISDSHMGFNKAANPDVVGTLQEEIKPDVQIVLEADQRRAARAMMGRHPLQYAVDQPRRAE